MTVSVDDLCVTRGGVPILSGVSFDLAEGAALILQGPNGSGKTTLLRTLAGLQPPLAGQISGTEDRIAYAAHSDGLKSMLSVAENLRFWAAVFGRSDIAPALQAFDLHDLADRLAGTLSAGQKRRLGLARLLVTGRPVWMLDEPTVSLDKRAVEMFAAAVEAHLATGGSALIATHIDLGLRDAQVLDVGPLRASPTALAGASDEAFL
ncbi:cytochrome c biogenesis ATP-binding export protein CcmA [Roseobacter denitrificans]|uniref:Cytochrome c biogenesis ATP-binding export protein CcmA n=1 Tax=Roseobacter denitrificans (strain ATCC 33942 / OCh 114) TaxID=375451 RepID=CCMA_ROSDO|nr:heme ABC exporter ATP-binding protein CcmA [Roseobacter denitrificans]Q166I9.1 RecName: Full=Cytochrome c biogenesis ATP-binding export protein CcmA; AltName: Full=Heme exporter protein A [Roseobacter denitrificans OCh 114]ABG32104.1 heme ABC exporter, ATP-binding protein CcmA, putative [Roseobacter denitrificans OCh 114]AVL51618.1 cytochrome c biogenesis ATP-binding export protein CcmA [Roseobacter denitrificans]SFF77367.1 heme exporter protein A [Roseobacter denitrificans OCh 114]